MSESSIPPSNGHINPSRAGYAYQMEFSAHQVLRNALQNGTSAPAPKPAAKPRRRRREERKSGLWLVLKAAQQHGITHPTIGGFLQLPREFDAILALEEKAVAQVVLEVLRQTIGRVGDGQDGRQEWAVISCRYFARAGLMSLSQAEIGLKQALDKGYIVRRPFGEQRFEYAVRWRGTN